MFLALSTLYNSFNFFHDQLIKKTVLNKRLWALICMCNWKIRKYIKNPSLWIELDVYHCWNFISTEISDHRREILKSYSISSQFWNWIVCRVFPTFHHQHDQLRWIKENWLISLVITTYCEFCNTFWILIDDDIEKGQSNFADERSYFLSEEKEDKSERI